jgi:hypothetical protein
MGMTDLGGRRRFVQKRIRAACQAIGVLARDLDRDVAFEVRIPTAVHNAKRPLTQLADNLVSSDPVGIPRRWVLERSMVEGHTCRAKTVIFCIVRTGDVRMSAAELLDESRIT